MKNLIPPLLAYLIVCIISVIVPASEGYNTVSWKLYVGQIYAIPVLIIAALVTFLVNKKRIY
ncbi:DUF4017 family protein [Neobacillus sp. MER 74]|uniref:DUF4017 family protein n=1 Tax=Bacillaceae TaxID=186817 RepID=UPI000BF3638F|nr:MULTISPECIES: DUF4017 family protein [Bacillaceae]MCM3118224.1 DUF4017 family protein [Neobacillus sp. MER 74]PFP25968.1 hypothetical protein COJ96_19670 [Bacillus sp. AFS073361]